MTNKMNMKNKKFLTLLGAIGAVALLLAPGSAQATLVTVDQIIFQSGSGQNPAGMSGTIDIVGAGTMTLTITMTNTSLDSAFTDATAPASMLLTGFGLQLGANILGGSVSVNGSTPLNFDVGQSLTDISNQYLFANQVIDGYGNPGVLAVDTIVSSVNNGQGTRFAGPPPVNIDGPGYGALSALETQFGASTPGVQDHVVFTLNLDANSFSLAQINAGNVVIAFGSPDTHGVPDGGTTLMLLGSAIGGLGLMRRFLKR
jgi:hypothetical protein